MTDKQVPTANGAEAPHSGNGRIPPAPEKVYNEATRRLEEIVSNIWSSREDLFNRLLGSRVDIDKECSYPDALSAHFYRTLYDRTGIAERVCCLMPKECFQVLPQIYEDEKARNETKFEAALDKLSRGLSPTKSWFDDRANTVMWSYMLRADILSGIGVFGIILIGIDDGLLLESPAEGTPADGTPKDIAGVAQDIYGGQLPSPASPRDMYPLASLSGTDAQYWQGYFAPMQSGKKRKGGESPKLTYLRVFDESLVQVVQYESSIFSPRFGQPVMYRVTLNDPRQPHTGIGLPLATVRVHWSRVVHIAENETVNSEVFAKPRQRPVVNNILDLRKLYGGSAEMYWQGAFPGLSIETVPQLGGDVIIDKEGIRDMMRDYSSRLQRWITLMGMSAKSLSPQVVDPTSQINVQIEAICIEMGCPIRVFKGSERGELASSQDDASWNDRLKHRQQTYLSPKLIAPFIDRLILLGVLPEPDGYTIHWPDLDSNTDKDRAGIALSETQAIAAYVAGNVESLVGPLDFMTRVLGWDEEEAEAVIEASKKLAEEKLEQHGDLNDAADEHGLQKTPPPGFENKPEPPKQMLGADGKPLPPNTVPAPGVTPGLSPAQHVQAAQGKAAQPPMQPPGSRAAQVNAPKPGSGAQAEASAANPKKPPAANELTEDPVDNIEQFHKPENYDKIRDLPDGRQLWAGANDWENGWTWAWIQGEDARDEPDHFIEINHDDCPGCGGDNETHQGKEKERLCRDWAKGRVEDWAKDLIDNAFCPTGKGGGRDNSCSYGKVDGKRTLLKGPAKYFKGAKDGGADSGKSAGGGDAATSKGSGGKMAAEAGGSGHEGSGGIGKDAIKSVSSGSAKAIPATIEEASKRIDRYSSFFRERGQHQVADWMDQLKAHVKEVGTDEALKQLGTEVASKGKGEKVQYAGHDLEGKSDRDFIEHYLDRNGISLVQTHVPTGEKRVISTVAASSDEAGTKSRGNKDDVFPTLQTLKHKLDETQHLPGLEKTEDLGKLMGKELGSKVEQFTPELTKKLDETYGKDQWIVKSYGDEAYAGYGIFFPQRAKQIQADAQKALWDSGSHLSKYGFSHLRDDKGEVVGIKHSGGDEYKFGTKKYDDTIHGDAKHWGDKAAEAAKSERGAAIPAGKFMASPAFPVVGISNEERAQGITFKKGQEGRVHITTKDGMASIVPHSTWLKQESMPVVFESHDTRAMAQAAVDAINALPHSERQGQLYAPDIVKTRDGYRVVEANPANEAGASGYLQDNPFIIDSYVSHVTGREPVHVKFIRKLLTDKKAERRAEKEATKGLNDKKIHNSRGNLIVNGRPIADVMDDIRKVADRLNDGQGYGDAYYNPETGEAWVSLGDWDEDEDADRYDAMDNIEGVSRVRIEAEASPRGPDWLSVDTGERIANSNPDGHNQYTGAHSIEAGNEASGRAYELGLRAIRSGDRDLHSQAAEAHREAASARSDMAGASKGRERKAHSRMIAAHRSSAEMHDRAAITDNIFCATGHGGGVDASCGKDARDGHADPGHGSAHHAADHGSGHHDAGHAAGHELEHAGHLGHETQEIKDLFGGGHGAAGAAHGAASHGHSAASHAAHDHHGGKFDAHAILAQQLMPHAIKAVTAAIDKLPGVGRIAAETITSLHEGSHGITSKAVAALSERYGSATAGAILGAGSLAFHSVIGSVGLHGTLTKFIPGKQFIGAIPLLALAEVGRATGLIGKDTKIEKGLTHVGTMVHATRSAIGKPFKSVATSVGTATEKVFHKTARAAGKLVGKLFKGKKIKEATSNREMWDNVIILNDLDIKKAADEFVQELIDGYMKLLEKHAKGLQACEQVEAASDEMHEGLSRRGATENVFCATGKGGGVKADCNSKDNLSPRELGIAWASAEDRAELVSLKPAMSKLLDTTSQQIHQELYRGLGVDEGNPILSMKAGDTFDIGPQSFSYERDTAEGYMGAQSTQGNNSVLIKAKSISGVDIGQLSGMNLADSEVISKGRFRVDKIRKVKDQWGKDSLEITVYPHKRRSNNHHLTFNHLWDHSPIKNVFCATGKGGGNDPSCSRGQSEAVGQSGGPSSPTAQKFQAEPKSPPPPGKAYAPHVETDHNNDGITDAARVGVPAMSVPPPPQIGRLPNLTPHERRAEHDFASKYEEDPDGVASKFLEIRRAAAAQKGGPPEFGTDDAKVLSKDWLNPRLTPDQQANNRATLNLALHQTGNAIAKRAFLQHLDTLKEGDSIMVTVGGCGAGKGYSLGKVPEVLKMKNESKAVWDSAGDQNATENPWIQREADKRGLNVTYAYVHADPETQWAHPERGVVKRAEDPKDGRMVDHQVFADSYVLGAQNHQAFYDRYRDHPSANFVFLHNGQRIDGIPDEAHGHDRHELATFAARTVMNGNAHPRIKRGALQGFRIWRDSGDGI